MRRLLLPSALAVVGLAAATTSVAQVAVNLPPGDGRELTAMACSQCHGLSVITAMRDGTPGWKHRVGNMVLRGAQLTPREADTVIGYLADNFGPVTGVANGSVALPGGPGKELVEQRCGLCHGLERVVAVKRRKSDWNGIVASMYERSGISAPDEVKTITAYLIAQFGDE